MSIPLPVEGVGKKPQVADQSLTTVTKRWMHLTVHAPLIADSSLPPLLGDRTLRRPRSLLDLGGGPLIAPGPGDVEL